MAVFDKSTMTGYFRTCAPVHPVTEYTQWYRHRLECPLIEVSEPYESVLHERLIYL